MRLARAHLVLLLLLPWSSLARADLTSPGELAKPHANLEGVGNCTKCHPAGKQLSAGLCLDCHVELKKRVDARRGFHGKMGETDRSTCQTCHHEHEGRDTKLVEWKPSKDHFDHARTGWPLRGKHAPVKCTGCHDLKMIVDADIHELLKKHPGTDTYLGTSAKCVTCHFDEHRGETKDQCETCHVEASWKPVPKFDHAKTKYPLTGLHKKVECAKCHPTQKDEDSHPAFPPPRAATFMKMNDIDHGKCTDCHEDVHDGRFGKRCEGCHSTEGWKTIKKTAEERAFHDKTRYPLKGMHATVACVSCHGPFPGRPAKFKNMTFGHCTDCHKDAHSGQMEKIACERCHTVEGFRPANFEIEEHAKTKYPLEGAHAAVACNRCHPNDAKLAQAAAGAAPAAPVKGNKGKGKGGKQAAVVPTSFFGPADQPLAAIVIKLGSKADRCEGCHTDVHAGQFVEEKKECATCHTPPSFTKLRFDHDKDSRFPLTGKHRPAACASCHKPVSGKGQVVRYRPLDLACASCHADVHLGQFGATGCEKCHNADDWKQLLFRHNDKRFTSYALDGKHAKVECNKCHTLTKVAVGKTQRELRRYRPLPRECESCHSDFHKGDFKGFEP